MVNLKKGDKLLCDDLPDRIYFIQNILYRENKDVYEYVVEREQKESDTYIMRYSCYKKVDNHLKHDSGYLFYSIKDIRKQKIEKINDSLV